MPHRPGHVVQPQGVPSNFVAIRPFLQRQGVADEDIGFDPNTGVVTVRGQRFFRPSINVAGRTFADPTDLPDVAPFLATTPAQQRDDVLAQLRQRIQQPLQFEETPFFEQFQTLAQRRGQAASERAMAETARRGILPSTITAQNVAQAQADVEAQLLPTFLQQAQQARQQEIANLMGLATFESQLEQQQFERQLAVQQQQIEAEQREIERNWNRVQQLGFVDNQASVALGIPVGTPTFEAQSAIEERRNRLQIARENNAAQLQQIREQQRLIAEREEAARTFQTELERRLEQARIDALDKIERGTASEADYNIVGIPAPSALQPSPDTDEANALSKFYAFLQQRRAQGLTSDQIREEALDSFSAALDEGVISPSAYTRIIQEINRQLPSSEASQDLESLIEGTR